jgi:transcriptional regulator with XRE-family HTH domain
MSIANCRKRAGLSAWEVADYIGVTTTCVSSWERGLHKPFKRNENELCDLLDVTPEELYAPEPPMKVSLKKLRELYGTTKAEHQRFCLAADTEYKNVERWFALAFKPKAHHLRNIAKAYGLEVKDLYELQMPR